MITSGVEVTFHTTIGSYRITMTEEGARAYVGGGWLIEDEAGGARPLAADYELAFLVSCIAYHRTRSDDQLNLILDDGDSLSIGTNLVLAVAAKPSAPGAKIGFGAIRSAPSESATAVR